MGSLLAALGIVFVAELGDKTQLVALGLGARHRLTPVLIGIAIGYAAVNLLSVTIGALLGAAFPTRAVGLAGGVLFLAFAARTLLERGDRGEPAAATDSEIVAPVAPSRSVIWSSAGAIFVAELGDKTMLATATLAADGDPVLVWVGATIGIVLSGALGVVVGRALGRQLPERVTRYLAAGLFAVFGAFLIVTNL
jgi:putative Ca2+/H+ antiporter (TMEM165/GDT1 family)